jgi:hypothetical protein
MIELTDLNTFLKMFSGNNITETQFINRAQVRVGKNLRPLKEYMLAKNIHKDNIKTLFHLIQNRNEYLTRFYNMSLRVQPSNYIIHDSVPPMKNKQMNNNDHPLFKNFIRNIHLLDILQNTKSGIDNVPTYMDVLTDLYLKNIIDYKILTPSSLHYMNEGRLGSVFSSFYFRASIMNPYLVYSLNHSLLKGTRIFTPTLGWTSYCYGFLECPYVVEYVGTDVIPSVCKTTAKFAREHSPNTTVDIYCKPSEQLFKSKVFMDKYKNHFDVVFFSPPYYRLELYDGENQSTTKYDTYEKWLDKYWSATIQLCKHVLQPGGRLCYILSGYGSDNTKENYNLLDDMNAITNKYFTFKGKQLMYNKNVHVTAHRETSEQIMLFVKK